MHIKQLNAAQLTDFLASTAFQNMPNVPISRIRGLSHAANPRADATDILLFLAEENGEMLGYFGMLPDYIYLQGKAEKVGWMSCLWIDPNTRGKGVAKALIENALQAWDDRMMVTEFTPEAGRLYHKMNIFQDLTIHQGIRMYDLQKWDSILLAKKPKLLPFSPFLKGFSFVTKPFFTFFRQKKQPENLLFTPVNEIDKAANAFIFAKNEGNLFQRSEKELNWLTHFPWIKQLVCEDTDKSDMKIAKRYHFSAQATVFKQVWIQVKEKKNDRLVACFMLSLREETLKTPYFFAENAYISEIAEWILGYMYAKKASILLTFQPELVRYFRQHHSLHFYIRNATRHYMLSKKFQMPDNKTFSIQDGDGDCAFT